MDLVDFRAKPQKLYRELIFVGRIRPGYMRRVIPTELNTTVLKTPLASLLPDEWNDLESQIKDKFFYNRPTVETITKAEDRLDEERVWPAEDEGKQRAIKVADKMLEPALTHKAWTHQQVYDHTDLKKAPGVPARWMGFKTRADLVKSTIWQNIIYAKNIRELLEAWEMVYTSTPKEEWASWEDLIDLKARTFQIPGYHVLHFQLLCFGEGNENIKNAPWSKYGFNPFMGGTDRFGKSLLIRTADGKYYEFPWRLAWDIRGYDRKIDLRNVARRRLRFFKVMNSDPVLVTIAEWVTLGMVYSIVILSNGDVVIRRRGNNSGSGMTTANNIEAGIEVMADILIYVYYMKYGYYPTEEEVIRQLIALYGDDNLACLQEEFSFICHKELVVDRLLKYHGLLCKEFVCGYEYSFDKLPFLGFTFHEISGHLFPKWRWERLLLPLVYTYRRHHSMEVYVQQFYSILLLSYVHEQWPKLRLIYIQLLGKLSKTAGSPELKAMIRLGAPTSIQVRNWYLGFEGDTIPWDPFYGAVEEVGPKSEKMESKYAKDRFAVVTPKIIPRTGGPLVRTILKEETRLKPGDFPPGERRVDYGRQFVVTKPFGTFDGVNYHYGCVVLADETKRFNHIGADFSLVWDLCMSDASAQLTVQWTYPPAFNSPGSLSVIDVPALGDDDQIVVEYPEITQNGADFYVSVVITGPETKRATFGPDTDLFTVWSAATSWAQDQVFDLFPVPDSVPQQHSYEWLEVPCELVNMSRMIKRILGINGSFEFRSVEMYTTGRVFINYITSGQHQKFELGPNAWDGIEQFMVDELNGVDISKVFYKKRLLVECAIMGHKLYNNPAHTNYDCWKGGGDIKPLFPHAELERINFKISDQGRVYEGDKLYPFIDSPVFVGEDYLEIDDFIWVKYSNARPVFCGLPDYSKCNTVPLRMVLSKTPKKFIPHGKIANGRIYLEGGYDPYGNQCRKTKAQFLAAMYAQGLSEAKALQQWKLHKGERRIRKRGGRVVRPYTVRPAPPDIKARRRVMANKNLRAVREKQNGYLGSGPGPKVVGSPYIQGRGDQLSQMPSRSAHEEAFRLSDCAAKYAMFLINPFIMFGDTPKLTKWWRRMYGENLLDTLPCVPIPPATPSFKFRVLDRFEINVGTQGSAFVAIAPLRPCSNYGTSNTIDCPIAYSQATWAGTDFPTLDNAAAPATGVGMKNWTSQFLQADVAADKKFRVCCLGLRVLYTGKLTDTSGEWHHFQTPAHTSLSGITPSNLATQNGYYTEGVQKKQWTRQVWAPVFDAEYRYKFDPIAGPVVPATYLYEDPQQTHHIGVLGKGMPVGATVRVEVVAALEAVGTTLPTKTPNSSDAVGMDKITSTVTPDSARTLNDKPGIMESLLKSADVSHVLGQIGRFSLNYAMNKYVTPMIMGTQHQAPMLLNTGLPPQSVTVEEIDDDPPRDSMGRHTPNKTNDPERHSADDEDVHYEYIPQDPSRNPNHSSGTWRETHGTREEHPNSNDSGAKHTQFKRSSLPPASVAGRRA